MLGGWSRRKMGALVLGGCRATLGLRGSRVPDLTCCKFSTIGNIHLSMAVG
jgi:hypothetical protein